MMIFRIVLFLLLVFQVGCGSNNSASPPPTVIRNWGTAEIIGSIVGSASNAQVAINDAGDAMVIWRQYYDSRYNIWAKRYKASSGAWGSAVKIQTNYTESAYEPQVAIDSNGNATAVWIQQNGGYFQEVWANRYNALTDTWGTAENIEIYNSNSSYSPNIAINASGNAIAIWTQSENISYGNYNIWINRYTASTQSWSTADLIVAASSDADITYPSVAIDVNNNALIVWLRSDNTNGCSIWSKQYNATLGTWSSEKLVIADTGNTYPDNAPKVSINDSGDAIAIWKASDGIRYNIWANNYTASTQSWGTAVKIETDNSGDAINPKVKISTSGDAIAIWSQSDGARYNIWTNHYTASTQSWGTAAQIETDNSGDTINPQVNTNAFGDAKAIWFQSDGTNYNVWLNLYQ
jgi:hypothetical protein